jgi:hypothetical protein
MLCRRSGRPDMGVRTSLYKPLCYVQGPPGRREPAPRLQRVYSTFEERQCNIARGRQKNLGD